MRPEQGLSRLLGTALQQIDRVVSECAPDWVVVQGTATVLAATLAAYHHGAKVAHVEAELRSGDLRGPFPEEGYRRAVTGMTDLHLVPTPRAAAALRAEGVEPARIVVTGNTVVDAVLEVRRSLPRHGGPPPGAGLHALAGARPRVLVTGHRRESTTGGLGALCRALVRLAAEAPRPTSCCRCIPTPRCSGSSRERCTASRTFTCCDR